ncbi:MAG: carbamate kinase [Clostridiales bacterium]|jgi:carbamate kinase|nr:carbamate kinase [Clostridiales bacterium]
MTSLLQAENVRVMRRAKRTSIAVAIGGNAIVREGMRGTASEQFAQIRKSCEYIADLYERGYSVVLTHGNGPQVGNLLLQNEALEEIPQQPLDICGAMTQGQIGYMIQQSMSNIFAERGIRANVVTVATQMVVSENDPAFKAPSKPIGPFYSKERAMAIMSENPGMILREDAGRGWRRVVASPEPIEMVEKESVKTLLEAGSVVIAAGGGGIPVIRGKRGLKGVEAVIDKDRATALVALEMNVDRLIILTGVDRVCINFRKPNQREIDKMTADEAQAYLEEGQFPAGSMGPKIQSAIEYIRNGGRNVIITSIEQLHRALKGFDGTVIVPHSIS